MKVQLAAMLIAATNQVGVESANTEQLDIAVEQQALDLQEQCKDFQQYDEESLLGLEEGAEVDTDEEKKALKRIKSSYKAHYGKTKAEIDKENNHILGTQATCLRFVKKYKGMPKVCSWCKQAKAPAIRWKWVTAEKVWYRWMTTNSTTGDHSREDLPLTDKRQLTEMKFIRQTQRWT